MTDPNTMKDHMEDLMNEVSDLQEKLRHMTRRWEAEADTARAAQHLYDLINQQNNTNAGGHFGQALRNLAEALRNRHDLDGGGR